MECAIQEQSSRLTSEAAGGATLLDETLFELTAADFNAASSVAERAEAALPPANT